jgi:hypothetical protein
MKHAADAADVFPNCKGPATATSLAWFCTACCCSTGFVCLLTYTLYPKMSKRSGRLGGKGAPGSARSAVLNALAALQPPELIPLLELLLLPISSSFLHRQQQQ